MSDINAITGTAATTTATDPNAKTKILGKDDFLKMLIAQLKNQDPTNPQQGTEFATQLAQFSSLEQLTNLNSAFTTQGNAQSISLIGKEITAKATAGAGGNTGATVSGQVTAVNFTNSAVTLTVNGQNIPFTDVLTVNAPGT